MVFQLYKTVQEIEQVSLLQPQNFVKWAMQHQVEVMCLQLMSILTRQGDLSLGKLAYKYFALWKWKNYLISFSLSHKNAFLVI